MALLFSRESADEKIRQLIILYRWWSIMILNKKGASHKKNQQFDKSFTDSEKNAAKKFFELILWTFKKDCN